MKRNSLKWALVVAVIIAAAAYFVISERDYFFGRGGDGNSFSGALAPGHSKAVDIEPLEGVRITAPENAFDKDRKIKMSGVSDATYRKVVGELTDGETVPLFVFDIDMGLKPGDHIPGDCTVSFDLDALGIPRDLQPFMQIVRAVESGGELESYRYRSTLSDGKLSFRTNQNSLYVGQIDEGGYYKSFLRTIMPWEAVPNLAREMQQSALAAGSTSIRTYFASFQTTCVSVEDPVGGDFDIYFRYDKTEDPTGKERYNAAKDKWDARVDELRQSPEVKREANAAKNLHKEWLYWTQEQREQIASKIAYESTLKKLIDSDPVLKDLAKNDLQPKLPRSVSTIIEDVKLSNKYLNDLGAHPLDFVMQIYLVDDSVLTSSINGAAKKLFLGNSCLVLNADNWHRGVDSTGFKKNEDTILTTVVHELFHARQQCYYNVFMMSSFAAEATAVVMERDAAIAWHKSGIVTTDASDFGQYRNIGTPRDGDYIFGAPFDQVAAKDKWTLDDLKSWDKLTAKHASNDDNLLVGYSIANAIEGIREGTGKTDRNMVDYVTRYPVYGPHTTGWTGWTMRSLGITKEELSKGWLYFGETWMQRVYDSQNKVKDDAHKSMCTVELNPTSIHPVIPLEKIAKPRDYTINTYFVDMPSERIPGKGIFYEHANIFIANTKDVSNPYVTFYVKDADHPWQTTDKDNNVQYLKLSPNYYGKGLNAYDVGVITTSQSAGDKKSNGYELVALFAPDEIDIKAAKSDKISFVIPKPAPELIKKGYVHGAVVTYKDKGGQVRTHDVAPGRLGKRLKWIIPGSTAPGSGFSLTAHYYYNVSDKEQYVSPESEPSTWGAETPEETPMTIARHAVDPKKGYWKQVRRYASVTSNSEGVDIRENADVSQEFRSINLKADPKEPVLELTGMASTEVVMDGKRSYVAETYLEGTVSYTEPPQEMNSLEEYKCEWKMDGDPYLKKLATPFAFTVEDLSSNPKACTPTPSKGDRIDTGRSKLGGSTYLRSATRSFVARFPEKDEDKKFSITQTFNFFETNGSDFKASATITYDYEWIFEGEEPEPEVEETPEGGYWKLVNVIEDNAKAKYEYRSTNKLYEYYQLYDITGGGGRFNLKIDQTMYGRSGTVSQSGGIVKPKQIYRPGESVAFDYSLSEPAITGKAFASGTSHSQELTLRRRLYGRRPERYDDEYIGWIAAVSASRKSESPDKSHMIVPIHDERNANLIILDIASAGVGQTSISHLIIYEYQWVDGTQEQQKADVPDGGYWSLYHTEVNTDNAKPTQGHSDVNISGGQGRYSVHIDEWGAGNKIHGTIDRTLSMDRPQTSYASGKDIVLKYEKGEVQQTGKHIGYYYPDFVVQIADVDAVVQGFDHYNDNVRAKSSKLTGREALTFREHVPEQGQFPKGFKIVEMAVGPHNCYVTTSYYYKWVEDNETIGSQVRRAYDEMRKW